MSTVDTEPRATAWAQVPRHFPPDGVRVVGSIVLSLHDWSRPRPGTPRMFEHTWLERLSRTNPAALPPIFLPPAALFLWLSVRSGVSVSLTAVLFGCGLLGWTLLEYLMHRFSFHFAPRSRRGMAFAYLIHGVHHAFPEDDQRWVMPPIASVPIALLVYPILRLSLGSFHAAVAAGLLVGYLCYDLTHYAVHRGTMKWAIVRALRRHHLEHHYRTPERRFGVTSPFWDHIFHTAK